MSHNHRRPRSAARVLLHDPMLPSELIQDALLTGSAIRNHERQPGGRPHQHNVECRFSEHDLILKCYFGSRRGIERLRPLPFTRAWRSYHAAVRLRAAGIATPPARLLVAWQQSLILGCDRIEGQQLYQAIRDKEWMKLNGPNLTGELTGLLQKLGQARITHGDLHPRNILVDPKGQCWLVDLDAVRFHKCQRSFLRKRRRDEHRLARELEIEPGLVPALGFKRDGEHWTLPPSPP